MGELDKLDLQAELEQAGWRVTRHDGEDWWEHEVWELVSAWRPTHAKAFLTFLVDPESKTSGIGDVWAIAVAREKPANRLEADPSAVRVSPRWPERMKEIVALSGSLRPSS